MAEMVPTCYGFSVVAVAQGSLDLNASMWWLFQWQPWFLASLPQCGGYWSLVVRVAEWLCLCLRRSLVAAVSVWWLLGDGPWMLLLRYGGCACAGSGP